MKYGNTKQSAVLRAHVHPNRIRTTFVERYRFRRKVKLLKTDRINVGRLFRCRQPCFQANITGRLTINIVCCRVYSVKGETSIYPSHFIFSSPECTVPVFFINDVLVFTFFQFFTEF